MDANPGTFEPELAHPLDWIVNRGTVSATCGAYMIRLDPDDVERFEVYEIETNARCFSGDVRPSTFETFDGWIVRRFYGDGNAAEFGLPGEGLAEWHELAQARVDVAFEEARAAIEIERQELLRRRIGRSAVDVRASVAEQTDWIVPGFLVSGWTTKLGGREKLGKGTLAFYLLSRVERGEETVFGPSKKMTALIVTEEPEESVKEKLDAFDLRDARVIYGYELAGMKWPEKVQRVVAEAGLDGHAIVFLDNVSRSAAIEDESGVEMGRAVEKLQDACRAAGLALLMDHHHKKGRDSVENMSRGGTGLPGATDINVEMLRVGKGRTGRKRRLDAVGRLRACNWVRTFELAEDGTDYAEVSNDAADDDDVEHDDFPDIVMLRTLAMSDGPVTAERFAAAIGKTIRTGRRRLKALVDEGLAELVEQQAGDGKFGQATWRPATGVIGEPGS
jgi:hypothetical protein